jgi:hypothetical protein
MGTQAQAVELLVIPRGAWDAVNEARQAVAAAQQNVLRSGVQAQNYWAWNNAVTCLGSSAQFFNVSMGFLSKADENLAMMAQLYPADPRFEQEMGQFEYNCAMAHSYASTGLYYAQVAVSQPNYTIQRLCAPAFLAAREAVQTTGRLNDQTAEETLEGCIVDPITL